MLQKHVSLLGFRVKDKVTGMTGVVTTICFDLYGCIQAVINPGLDKEGKQRDSNWYDVNRLKIISKKSIMDSPNFVSGKQAEGRQGAADKPLIGKP